MTTNIKIGYALWYFMQLHLGVGYENLSAKRREELLNTILKSFNDMGEIKIDSEDWELIKERIK